MLIALSIEKFALVDSLYLEFSEGLNILTGETGAGKSILIHALSQVLGERSNRDYVMNGSEQAQVEATFGLSQAQREEIGRLGVEADESITLQRTIKRSGSSLCRVNGKIMPLSMMAEIAGLLLEIHGQHENQLLFDKSNHLQFLDGFGEREIGKPQEEYLAAYLRYGKLKKKMISDEMNPQLVAQRGALLREQYDEFARLNWRAGEEAELTQRVQELANHERLCRNLDRAYDALYEQDDSALSQLKTALEAVGELGELGQGYRELAGKLDELYFSLEDATLTLREMRSGSGFSQEELEAAQKQLFAFSKLKRQFGGEEQAVLAHFEAVKAEMDEMQDRMENAQEYKKKLQELFVAAKQKAGALSDARKKVAKELEKELLAHLGDLGMEKSQFVVDFGQSKNLSRQGLDDVEFLFSANAGESVKPMAKVASGGEISRLMLAFKNIDLRHRKIDAMVFDEIDIGISGKMAQAVAEKLANIARENQVLCVTHLPQVAAMSDRHFLVEKREEDGKTRVSVHALNAQEQAGEIARLVSGKEITPAGLNHAKELLALAGKYKNGLAK